MTYEPGFCQCGCGGRTAISKGNDPRYGWVAGQPFRFLGGHQMRLVGHRPYKSGDGYYRIYQNVDGGRKSRPIHVLMAERALGKPLPKGAQVHHVNGDRSDNSRGNLVLCQDAAYHTLLHKRTEALQVCGNPDFRQCRICRTWDSTENATGHPMNGKPILHPECHREWNRRANRRRRANRKRERERAAQ